MSLVWLFFFQKMDLHSFLMSFFTEQRLFEAFSVCGFCQVKREISLCDAPPLFVLGERGRREKANAIRLLITDTFLSLLGLIFR